jgi:type IV pilus assembly protein PilM
MPVQSGVWGIDLGQCALKALRVENLDGQVTATAFDYVEHPKILSQPDADPDQLTREALEKFLSRNTLRGDTVIISIPGQSGLARFVKLPPVEEKKIGDIVRFEAKQQIPFNLEEVVWDYQKLGSGVVTDGFAMETEIGLFAIKRDTVNHALQQFKDVNVEVQVVQMSPLALCNYVSYDLLEQAAEGDVEPGKKRCVVALDIGTDSSNLVITDGQRIIWQRPIPLGGNHFTRALSKDMKLTFAKAEHLKRNATKSPELKQILASLKPVLNDFVGEVQRSLGYFTNTHRDASVEYMIGLGSPFRLPGLQKFLSEKLQIEVRRLQKLERLAGDEVVTSPVYQENVLSFGVAYGLALQGLGLARLHTNLLPQEIRMERLIRAKKPWAVTAAAALLLGTSVLGMGYFMQHRAVASDPVAKAMDKGKSVKKTADDFKTKVDGVEAKIKADKDAVKSILIGQDERFNWMRFNQFLNSALPKPDASNLSDQARDLYWNGRAEEALGHLLVQETGKGHAGPKTDEESWRPYLIQANVEGVYCVFSDNLAGYHAAIMKDDQVFKPSMSDEDQKKAPDEGKKGWIVEVRGYTYHQDGLKFVTLAVVNNLARLPIKKPAGAEGTQTAQAGAQPGAAGTAPAAQPAAPAAAPAAQPAAPGAAQPAAPGGTENQPKEQADDPVINKVSHVVLYRYIYDENPDPNTFVLINGGHYADQLAAAAPASSSGGGGEGGPMGGMMAQMGAMKGGLGAGGAAAGKSWSPLTGGGMGGTGSAAAGKGGMMGGEGVTPGGGGGVPNKFGGGSGISRPSSPSMSGGGGAGGMKNFQQAMGPRPTAPAAAEAPKGKKALTRTEFIITFIWTEPTPSDALLPQEDTTSSDSSGAAGGSSSPIAGGSGRRGKD